MSVNFQQAACHQTLSDPLFGLCDGDNGTKAYPDTADPAKWVAVVKNDTRKAILFIAVDKCIIYDHEYPGRGRCDGILTTVEHLFFVELKDRLKNWVQPAIEQLGSTIQFFVEGNDMTVYRHKKAFVCNKKHPRFQEIDNELNLRFFRQYGVRLDVQAEVIIV
jgi:hypothetical protein